MTNSKEQVCVDCRHGHEFSHVYADKPNPCSKIIEVKEVSDTQRVALHQEFQDEAGVNRCGHKCTVFVVERDLRASLVFRICPRCGSREEVERISCVDCGFPLPETEARDSVNEGVMNDQLDHPASKTIEQIAEELATEIYHNATNSRSELKRLLIEFAQEIKREAIEP